jgi:hypothetical protein
MSPGFLMRRFEMRPRLGILIGVVLVAMLVVGAVTVAGAKEPSGPDSLPAFSAAEEPLELVGDAGALRLGVSIVSDTEAVAYLCDGESVGVWFTGTVDLESGEVNLKSDKGGTVTLNLNSDPTVATVVVDGETTNFTLAPVTGNGGVFRSVSKVKGDRWTTGWIIADDSTIVGITADESGRTVTAVNSSAGGGGSAGTVPPGSDPVATGAIRCSILAGRISRQARLTEAATTASGATEHSSFVNGLVARADGLGCAGFS